MRYEITVWGDLYKTALKLLNIELYSQNTLPEEYYTNFKSPLRVLNDISIYIQASCIFIFKIKDTNYINYTFSLVKQNVKYSLINLIMIEIKDLSELQNQKYTMLYLVI